MSRKLALITGGTSGIGLAIAKELAETYDLALAYAGNHERAATQKKEIEGATGARVEIYAGVLTDYESCKTLVDKTKEDFGVPVSVLVNSAGRIRDGLFMGTDFSEHQEHINEHLVVPMALAHLTVKGMYRERFGRIINLSSISARYAKRGQANYAAAKAGIEGFTQTLAAEVAHRGVTVNAIAPGLVETPMTEHIIKMIEEKYGKLSAKIPVGRAAKPEEVGKLARFLCSEDAAYITGQTHTIDGGRSLGDMSS